MSMTRISGSTVPAVPNMDTEPSVEATTVRPKPVTYVPIEEPSQMELLRAAMAIDARLDADRGRA